MSTAQATVASTESVASAPTIAGTGPMQRSATAIGDVASVHQGRLSVADGGQAAASSRVWTPSLEMISATWYLAVAKEMSSRWAICSLVRPSRRRSRTCHSRRVRMSGWGGRPRLPMVELSLRWMRGNYTSRSRGVVSGQLQRRWGAISKGEMAEEGQLAEIRQAGSASNLLRDDGDEPLTRTEQFVNLA